jgi:hypothetical protein
MFVYSEFAVLSVLLVFCNTEWNMTAWLMVIWNACGRKQLWLTMIFLYEQDTARFYQNIWLKLPNMNVISQLYEESKVMYSYQVQSAMRYEAFSSFHILIMKRITGKENVSFVLSVTENRPTSVRIFTKHKRWDGGCVMPNEFLNRCLISELSISRCYF